MADRFEKICEACKGHCSGQVRAAKSPCDYEYCWSKGGSEESHLRNIADKPIIVEKNE